MLPCWSATGAGSPTTFIELTSSLGHSGKSPTAVGDTRRRWIGIPTVDEECTGNIAHLEAPRSISSFVRYVNIYFRFLFASVHSSRDLALTPLPNGNLSPPHPH